LKKEGFKSWENKSKKAKAPGTSIQFPGRHNGKSG